MNKVLDVQNLHVSFDTYAGEVKAVRGVTFSLSEGEVPQTPCCPTPLRVATARCGT